MKCANGKRLTAFLLAMLMLCTMVPGTLAEELINQLPAAVEQTEETGMVSTGETMEEVCAPAPMAEAETEPTEAPTEEPTEAPTEAPEEDVQQVEAPVVPAEGTDGGDDNLGGTEEKTLEIRVESQYMLSGKTQKIAVWMDGAEVALDQLTITLGSGLTMIRNILVAERVNELVETKVRVELKNDPSVCGEYVVYIRPLTAEVQIITPESFIDLGVTKEMNLSAVCLPEGATDKVTWSSSDKKIMTVDENGKVTALKAGKATIKATAADGSAKVASVKLEAKYGVHGISITGGNEVASGMSLTLKAVLDPSNATYKTVKWSLDCDSTVATVSAGKVTAKTVAEPVEVTVRATAADNESVYAEHVITVRPKVAKVTVQAPDTKIDIADGVEMQLTNVNEPAGASQKVTWSSSDKKVATVDANGLVTAIKPGKVTITATSADGTKKVAKVALTITATLRALEITGNTEMAAGKTATLKIVTTPACATSKSVTWSLDCPSTVATIKDGKVTAKKISGIEVITVKAVSKTNPEIYDEHVIEILPQVSKVMIDAPSKVIDLPTCNTLQLTAANEPFDASQKVTWSSSNKKIATVDENGLVTALKTGSVTITAKAADGSGKTASVALKVVVAVHGVEIACSDEMTAGKTLALKAAITPSNATNKAVTWSLDCPSTVATIKGGKITAKNVKELTVITVKAVSKENAELYAEKQIIIYPQVTKIVIDAATKVIDLPTCNTLQLTAANEPVDASQKVTWSSSDKKIATVDENGLVTALKTGSVTITAKAADGSGKSAKITLNVVVAVQGLEISGSNEMAAGKSVALKPVFTPSNATNKGVTWSLDCPSTIATIKDGKVTAKAISNIEYITVTATSKENPAVFAVHSIIILPQVKKVTISAPGKLVDMNVGGTMQLSAACEPVDASQNVTWKSSNTKIATVDANGLVTAVKPGKVTITATAADGTLKFATVALDVVYAVQGLEITGADQVLTGKTITLKTAFAPENATNKSVKWSVDCDKTVATISTTGKLTAKKAGIVTVTATSKENPEIFDTHEVRIVELTKKLSIDAASWYIDINAEDKTLQLYTEYTPATADPDVTWSSSNAAVATVDENGLVTGHAQGTAIITAKATDGSKKTAKFEVSVIVPVESIEIICPDQLSYGESAEVSVKVYPENATYSDCHYYIDWPNDYAYFANSDGKLYARPIENDTYVTVYAYNVMDDTIVDTHQVLIKGCGVTAADRDVMNDVYWISDRSITYRSAKDYHEFTFKLKNYAKTKTLRAPVFVEMYIMSDDGTEVYRETRFLTQSDYKLVNGDWAAYIYIKDEEIAPCEDRWGDFYYHVYAPGYISYDWFSLSINGTLPEYDAGSSCTLELPSLPYLMKTWTNSNQTTVETMTNITGITYKFSETYDGTCTLYVYFTGTKTYDYKGSHNSSSCRLTFKLYDEDGYVVADDYCLTSAVAMGESFRNQKAIVFDLEPGVNYRLELLGNY